MVKINSNLELPIPRAIADRHGIRPGDELDVLPANDGIRVIPARRGQVQPSGETRQERFREMLKQYDATADKRPAFAWPLFKGEERGWHREDLYEDRGFSR